MTRRGLKLPANCPAPGSLWVENHHRKILFKCKEVVNCSKNMGRVDFRVLPLWIIHKTDGKYSLTSFAGRIDRWQTILLTVNAFKLKYEPCSKADYGLWLLKLTDYPGILPYL